ncbi:S26 family signal peptidase [Cereibacter sphaeroides]
MGPTLPEGSVHDVNLTDQFGLGDIIVFPDPKDSSRLLVKRLLRSEDKGLFVIGDNVRNSRDSRHFGLIDPASVIGKIEICRFPKFVNSTSTK